MSMTNRKVVEAWIKGKSAKSGNPLGGCHCKAGELFSFAVCIAKFDETDQNLVHVDISKYSRTTSTHQTLACIVLLENGWEAANEAGTIYRKGA